MACLFCNIVEGAQKATVVLDDGDVLAFRDIAPVAPTHVLVIPKRHIAGIRDASAEDAELMGKLLIAARKVAEQEGIVASGFRTVINDGADAKQAVQHLHVHVLGGREMSWPPG